LLSVVDAQCAESIAERQPESRIVAPRARCHPWRSAGEQSRGCPRR